MKMIFKGMVAVPATKEPKAANALFWTTDQAHQVSLPVDKEVSKCCANLKDGDEVDFEVSILPVHPRQAVAPSAVSMPALSESTKKTLQDIAIAAMGAGTAIGAFLLAKLVMG